MKNNGVNGSMNPMQRNYTDRDQAKKFRHAYVFKGSFNFASLKPYCERIIYATDGLGDHVDNIKDQLEDSLSNFDDGKDVIIPIGSTWINFVAGTILQKKLSEKYADAKRASYAIGVWSDGDYKFWTVYTDAEMEAYEVIQ